MRNNICQSTKPLKVFGLSEIEQAFRFLAARDRIGKVVVDFVGMNMASPVEVSFRTAPEAVFSMAEDTKRSCQTGTTRR